MKPPQIRLVKGYGMPPQPPDELEAAIARFILARAAIGKNTRTQYRRCLTFYRSISPEWPPTPEGLATFIEHLKDRYEPNTVHTYYSIVRNFIRFACKRRLITDDPLDLITAPRRPGNLPRAPLSETLQTLMAYLEREVERVISIRHKPYLHYGWREVRNLGLYSLMLDSGLRVSEAGNVRLVDVDIENWLVFVDKGKGSKQREVPLGRTTRADLKLWLDWRDLVPIKANDPGQKFLFISHRRGWVQMSAAHIEKTLARVCLLAGISPKITPHQLRHAFASLSHANGAPVGRIQQWLGHSDIGTTGRYLVTREGLREHLKSSPRDHQH